MGTSTSSSGPGPGVPFDPPWLEEIGDGGGSGNGDNNDTKESNAEGDAPNGLPTHQPLGIAPPRRFANARRFLGKFANDGGGRGSFNQAAGHYSKVGMGGAASVSNRMRNSTKAAANLANFLGNASTGTDPNTVRWVQEVSSQDLSTQEIIDEIIRHVAPSKGSRDEESCSDSMAQAMSEFLEIHQDQDLLNLNEPDIREITELFISNEAYNRLINDIGQVFESSKLTPMESVKLGKEMREYLTADISVQIQNLWKENSNPSQTQLDQILKSAIENTFTVYEDGI